MEGHQVVGDDAPGEAPSNVADLMIRFLRVSGPSRAGPKTGGAGVGVPVEPVTGSVGLEQARVAHGSQHLVGEVGVADDEIGQPRIGAGVAER